MSPPPHRLHQSRSRCKRSQQSTGTHQHHKLLPPTPPPIAGFPPPCSPVVASRPSGPPTEKEVPNAWFSKVDLHGAVYDGGEGGGAGVDVSYIVKRGDGNSVRQHGVVGRLLSVADIICGRVPIVSSTQLVSLGRCLPFQLCGHSLTVYEDGKNLKVTFEAQ